MLCECQDHLDDAYLPCSLKDGGAMKYPDEDFLVTPKLQPNHHNAIEAYSLQAPP